MRFTGCLSMLDDPLFSELSYINLFIFDVWIFELVRFLCVDVFACRCRWMCVESSVAHRLLSATLPRALERLMFVLDDCFLPFDGVSFNAYSDVNAVGGSSVS